MQSLINVSNRLPVTVGETIEKSSGGLVAAMEDLEKSYALRWIGWAGGTVDDERRREEIRHTLRDEFNYTPVFLTREQAENYYTGFANSSLWPLLHYMPTYARYSERWFEFYREVNRLFADVVIESVGDEDIVWIHDYHLMLLPSMLRREKPDLTIGYFLHTPFPSYEIFRCHPDREELLQGLLGANLLGFHTFGYLRHFRSTVLRTLGIESEMTTIHHETHRTNIGVYPIGVNAEKFLKEMQTGAYRQCLENYRRIYRDKKIVLSVERLDYTKGIPRRLEAIERFLKETGRTDVLFIFISVPSRESVREYQKLIREVELKVSRINGKYSTIESAPVHFINQSVNFSELCALYSLADVAMVTPLMDGMNLVAKEYLVCQGEKSGVLILSEFAGAAQELPNACIVNPYNVKDMTRCLKKALIWDKTEKMRMIDPMRERVIKYDAKYWADSFIRDAAATRALPEIATDTRTVSDDVLRKVLQAGQPALFLDYDGTLADLKRKPADAAPDEEIVAVFGLLQGATAPEVFLTSGRKKEDMDHWFSDYGFNLIAEHGYYYKHRNAAEWLVFEQQSDLSWKSQVIEVFQMYTAMTPGSHIEEKTSSVVWHYRGADPEFGVWKANQLVAELYDVLSNLPVEVHHGKKIVEVGSMQINKGRVLEYFLMSNKYDALLCAGDDETDESMFRLEDGRITSLKVGRGETAAAYRINSPGAFRAMLRRLLADQGSS
jgi:trehalose 6-phosphate synthase/phosphatase